MQLIQQAKTKIRCIDRSEAKELMKHGDITLLDVREKVENDAGHIEGSEHISRGVLEKTIQPLQTVTRPSSSTVSRVVVLLSQPQLCKKWAFQMFIVSKAALMPGVKIKPYPRALSTNLKLTRSYPRIYTHGFIPTEHQ